MTKLQKAVLDAAKIEYMKCSHDSCLPVPTRHCEGNGLANEEACVHLAVCKAVHALLTSDAKPEVVEAVCRHRVTVFGTLRIKIKFYLDECSQMQWVPEPDTWYRIEKMEKP